MPDTGTAPWSIPAPLLTDSPADLEAAIGPMRDRIEEVLGLYTPEYLKGTLAARPGAPDRPTLYYVTGDATAANNDKLYFWQASTWTLIAHPPANPGTSVPAGPSNGDQFIYTPRAWLLRYDSGISKWRVIGAAPITAESLSSRLVTSATYVEPTVLGMSLPLKGNYIIEAGFTGHVDSTAGLGYMSYDLGAVAAVDADAATVGTLQDVSTARLTAVDTAADADMVSAKLRASGGVTFTSINRWIKATPVTIDPV